MKENLSLREVPSWPTHELYLRIFCDVFVEVFGKINKQSKENNNQKLLARCFLTHSQLEGLIFKF